MLKLYGYWRSSAAYRVRIALNLKGLAYEMIPVNLKPGVSEQKTYAYLELNPQGRVPYLIDGDIALSQSPAILEYLEESCTGVPLMPIEVADKAYVRQLVNLIACDIHPINNLAVLERLKSQFSASVEDTEKWYRHWITEGFEAFEKHVSASNNSGRFCFGDNPTLADVCLVPQVWNARRFKVDMSAFPVITAIDENCNALEAFKAAAPEVQPDAPSK